MVIENFTFQPEGVCGVMDRNYQYHFTTDTLTYINQDTGFAILKANLAALVQIARPLKGQPMKPGDLQMVGAVGSQQSGPTAAPCLLLR